MYIDNGTDIREGWAKADLLALVLEEQQVAARGACTHGHHATQLRGEGTALHPTEEKFVSQALICMV